MELYVHQVLVDLARMAAYAMLQYSSMQIEC